MTMKVQQEQRKL